MLIHASYRRRKQQYFGFESYTPAELKKDNIFEKFDQFTEAVRESI